MNAKVFVSKTNKPFSRLVSLKAADFANDIAVAKV